METPGYDIFATKGIEYILVIGFLAAFIVFSRALSRSSRPIPALAPVRRLIRTASGWFNLPPDRYYHPGHTWARIEDDGLVTIGIDDFAQKLVGRPEVVDLPEVGSNVEQGASGPRLAVDSRSVALLSPLDGTVVARNDALQREPSLINDDPYGEGWLFKIAPSRIKTNLNNLMRETMAKVWMEHTERTLRNRASEEVGTVLQDGGLPVTGIARSISGEGWDDLAREFLLN